MYGPLLRLLRSFGAVAVGRGVLLAFLLPLALGPALPSLATALGGTPEHVCACGMKQGTCGCPECERELGLAEAGALSVHAVLTSCDDHHRAAPGGGAVASVLPASIVVHASPLVTRACGLSPQKQAPRGADAPPTRPPRA